MLKITISVGYAELKSPRIKFCCRVLLLSWALPSLSQGATSLLLGLEYQAQAGSNAGTIRGGDPADAQAFTDFLGTANLTRADILTGDGCATAAPGVYATWGSIAENQAALNLGATMATASLVGWDGAETSPSGSASLAWSYNNSSALQSGAPRPGFASGSGSGYGIRTNGGSTTDGVRNAVKFTFSNPISAFGIFGGDLETGALNSPEGLLHISFTDSSTETIFYSPDSTLFSDASYSSTGNNLSETYGNETGRFVGVSDDTRLISSVIFVVGDDDQNDDGDSEQLSFIAPMTFTEVSASGECTNHIPNFVVIPEPSVSLLGIFSLLGMIQRKRRNSLDR